MPLRRTRSMFSIFWPVDEIAEPAVKPAGRAAPPPGRRRRQETPIGTLVCFCLVMGLLALLVEFGPTLAYHYLMKILRAFVADHLDEHEL